MIKRNKIINNASKWKPDIKTVILTIVGEVIIVAVTYYLPPIHTDTSVVEMGLNFVQWNPKNENDVCNMFFANDPPRLEVYLDNNNSGFIRILDIYVKVLEYKKLGQDDVIYRPDIGGLGDAETPIYLKAQIKPHIGRMKTEFDQKLNQEYGRGGIDSNDYIELSADSSDKYHITMNTKQQGHYRVKIEFIYKYHGWKHSVSTEAIDYVYFDIPEEEYLPLKETMSF